MGYNGLVHGVRTMVAEEGIGSIYKGFTGYLKGDEDKSLHPTVNFLCGSFSGAVSVYSTMPFDVVKTQMQGLDAAKFTGPINCGVTVFKESGITGLWKGTTPRLGRVMFSGGIIFAVYEEVMKGILYVSPDN